MPTPAGPGQYESSSSREETLELLGKIQIPPQPEIVRTLLAERGRNDPDVQRLAGLIADDAALSTAVLMDANSPYRRRSARTDSIAQAVTELGVTSTTTVALGEILRCTLTSSGTNQFWDRIGRSAQLANLLAAYLGLDMSDDAQLYVLFHDCGIPLLLEAIPGYRDTLEQIASTEWLGVEALEDARHHINHAVVGGLLANIWALPPAIRDATSLHHYPQIFESTGVYNEVLTLIALGHTAEMIEEKISHQPNDNDWKAFSMACMRHLMISDADLQELTQTANDLFAP